MHTQVPTVEQTRQPRQTDEPPMQLQVERPFADTRSETAQLKLLQAKMASGQTSFNLSTTGILQAKTDVKENKTDAIPGETSSKKIATPTQGTKWFRFKINDNVIDTFANNIYPHSAEKGSSPVHAAVEIGAQATIEEKDPSTLGGMSRARHFGFGDRAMKQVGSGYRKGKLTWHHQMGKYNMELVDMYVHGGFGHHGGYASWSEDDDDIDGE